MWMGMMGQEDVEGRDRRMWRVGCMRDVKKRRRRNMKGGGDRRNLDGVGGGREQVIQTLSKRHETKGSLVI